MSETLAHHQAIYYGDLQQQLFLGCKEVEVQRRHLGRCDGTIGTGMVIHTPVYVPVYLLSVAEHSRRRTEPMDMLGGMVGLLGRVSFVEEVLARQWAGC
ncbi:hypothetical protein L873DRAFT_1801058 [Choiromyces venosus 120613-1]|uniref:Uncharacterized protein n=1 Tax=Choiromyces venosus 120613-1 TaxID=1336337 RepID=A0A3N4JYE9_9PEZI|nr:hypothetical protein L873DRAFT_1801058 [Choiromyces venosus 120613-1]